MSLELAIKENTEVIRQLITIIQLAEVFKSNEKSAINVNPIKATATLSANKISTQPIINSLDKIDIGTLNLEKITTLAVLFNGDDEELTRQQLEKINQSIESTGKKRNRQADALYMTLANLDLITNLSNTAIHYLCLELLANWNSFSSITERRKFAESLLNGGKKSSEIKTEVESVNSNNLLNQAEIIMLQLAKGGYRNEAVAILSRFGAKKLSQIPVEKLSGVIELAEKILIGE